ncbi:vanadium-dependent haloperoxidase [Falsiroseomonas selenitidurans]|uniref:Vanadium-dependent haloperoxidase n=1 Tax=Falsiroseomonas selenitidurans TaxID=2716335 RepID=A0ABX1E0J3_9PROT|nr:vanadium-dependent haloperoxidase [Falsiroseomonas selenitidurans]NKC30676.1 vanadium-dependent haloperoxidase [Falsiroseomonas selenitidurans]
MTSHPTPLMPQGPSPNGDETTHGKDSAFPFIGNFHKTLPHDRFGMVDPAAYEVFRQAAADTRPGPAAPDYESLGGGAVPPGSIPAGNRSAAPLVSPQAGRARELLGLDPFQVNLWPAPKVLSDSTAAEMTELFWMALWRDVPFDALQGGDAATMASVQDAVAELTPIFERAIAADGESGIRPGLDLPMDAQGRLDLNPMTLFRSGFQDEQLGPMVSQFFLHDVPFGTQTIRQTQFPYAPRRDYLQNTQDWLMAQNIGRDTHGRPYPNANDFGDDNAAYEPGNAQRYIGSMRDLARFVHKDALHQAYFNAALLLLDWGAPFDAGNPYASRLSRQAGFATLGGPNLLTMVSEVASRALKVVWRQKWMVHRRLRPEAYGGLMTMQHVHDKAIGLPDWVFTTRAAAAIRQKNHAANAGTAHAAEDNFLLPMAFTSGAPAHPAYGAGHATVAGACVTVLKAWFEEKHPIKGLVEASRHPQTRAVQRLLQPTVTAGALPAYAGADAGAMTVGGELNKIASNVAMGRTMGGVHWRSDNTRSLRLGEAIATVIMAREVKEYAEADVSFRYCSFDRHEVLIDPSGVKVPGDPPLQAWYAGLLARCGI